MVALGEELDGFGGAQRGAQQSLPVGVLPEMSEDVAVGGLQPRQAGLVLGLFAGCLMPAVTGGDLAVYDTVAEAVVAVELLRGVTGLCAHGEVRFDSERVKQEETRGLEVPLPCGYRWLIPGPGAHPIYRACRMRIRFSFVRVPQT